VTKLSSPEPAAHMIANCRDVDDAVIENVRCIVRYLLTLNVTLFVVPGGPFPILFRRI
jgi:hypothetical protein